MSPSPGSNHCSPTPFRSVVQGAIANGEGIAEGAVEESGAQGDGDVGNKRLCRRRVAFGSRWPSALRRRGNERVVPPELAAAAVSPPSPTLAPTLAVTSTPRDEEQPPGDGHGMNDVCVWLARAWRG